MIFDEKPVNGKFIQGYDTVSALDGARVIELYFKIAGRKTPVLLSFRDNSPYSYAHINAARDFCKKHLYNDTVTLLQVGAGKYAGFRLFGY